MNQPSEIPERSLLFRSVCASVDMPLMSFVAISTALITSMRYMMEMKLRGWEEYGRYFLKSARLAACYVHYSHGANYSEAVGAGKAAFLSSSYDVATDWEKDTDVEVSFLRILRLLAPSELSQYVETLFRNDQNDQLSNDGLERGVVAFRFVLEMMGLTELYQHLVDIDDLGECQQIVDDILDLEEDRKFSHVNALLLGRKEAYIERMTSTFSEERLKQIFPYPGVLGVVIEEARKKAFSLLQDPEAPQYCSNLGHLHRLFLMAWGHVSSHQKLEDAIIYEREQVLISRNPDKYARVCRGMSMLRQYEIIRYSFFPFLLPSIAPAFVPSYYFCRTVDDIADGDEELPRGLDDFEKWIDLLKFHIDTDGIHIPDGVPALQNYQTEFLLKRILKLLPREHLDGDNIHSDLIWFLDTMVFEQKRREQRILLSESELHTHWHDSFDPIHNIAFIANRSQTTRAKDVPELSQIQGRMYAIYDVIEELPKGFVNIPKEIILNSGLHLDQIVADPASVYLNSVIREWMEGDMEIVTDMIKSLRLKQKSLDWRATSLVDILIGGVEEQMEHMKEKLEV